MKQTLSSPQCGAQVLSFWDEGIFAELERFQRFGVLNENFSLDCYINIGSVAESISIGKIQ